jgi:L-amino acid N-acyltransferase YncA
MIFRDAHLDDLAGIVAIYNSTIASREVTADVDPVTVDSRLGWFHEHTAAFRPLWVVESDAGNGLDGSGLLGWLSFSSFYGRPAYRHTAEISIYLAPAARGKRIGTELVQRAVEFAPGIGVKTLLGFIFGHNRASLALFQRQGFSTWAHLPGVAELDGIERDLVILGRRIDPV